MLAAMALVEYACHVLPGRRINGELYSQIGKRQIPFNSTLASTTAPTPTASTPVATGAILTSTPEAATPITFAASTSAGNPPPETLLVSTTGPVPTTPT